MDELMKISREIIKKTGINESETGLILFLASVIFSSSSQDYESILEQLRLHQDHHED